MNKGMWFGGAAGVLVVMGLGLYFWLQAPNVRPGDAASASAAAGSAVRPGPGPGPSLGTGAAPATSVQPGGHPAPEQPDVTGAASTPAPWMVPGAGGSTGAAGVGGVPATGIQIGKPGAPSLNDVQQRLQALVTNGRQPSPREVEAVLADLQRNQGSNVVNGVNVQALRDNLVRVDRIQQIAQEMQVIAANPRKEDLPRLQALSSEMQRLNAAMVIPVAQPAVR